jgi:hypothetical protein
VLALDRHVLLTELTAHLAPDGRGGAAGPAGADGRLIQAALLLDDHLERVAETWRRIVRSLWRRLRETEAIAADLLSSYLTHNLVVAYAERERYLYPGTALPRVTSDAFRGLRRGIDEVAAARRNVELDQVITEQRVVTAVTLATCALAGAGLVARRAGVGPLPGAEALDRPAWDAIAAAAGLADAAARTRAEAATAFLQALRRVAAHHPVVLLLDHRALAGRPDTEIGRAVAQELTAAEEAIGRLRASGVNRPVVPFDRGPLDTTPSGLAERIARAGTLSVWKLPFFVGQALLQLPPAQAIEVKAVMAMAAERAEGTALRQAIATTAVDAASVLAPAAGTIGVVLALGWAIVALGRSIQEYRQLGDLFHATLDPKVLLRGLDHAEASKVDLVLDVFGLAVW